MLYYQKSDKIIDMEKLVLIDGNSLLNRAYYSTPLFTTQSGTPTNAIFGFIKFMLKICDDLSPEYLVVAFDLKAPTFRHKMYEGYKANRSPMPEDLAAQLQPLKTLLNTMKIATYEKEGIEADDIIGTLSNKFNLHSFIYTGDRDCYQLVDEKTEVYFTKRGVTDLLKLNNQNFKETLGYTPQQVIDLKSLMGDKSDNIPGVHGIGEKTAFDLVNKYGSLLEIYNHIDELKTSIKGKLLAGKDSAELSYKLAKINRNCDLDINLENCKAPKKYGVEVKHSFAELEFKSLLKLNIYEKSEENENTEETLPIKIANPDFKTLKQQIGKCNSFFAYLDENKINLYFNGIEYEVTYKQIILDDEIGYNEYIEILKDVFTNKKNSVTVYDYKSTLHLLKSFGIEGECDYNDLSLLIYLTDYSSINLNLFELIEYNSLNKNYPAYSVFSLFTKYYALLSEENNTDLYDKIEKPLVKVLFTMECEGIKISESHLNALSEQLSEKIEDFKTKIYNQAGTKFNINSPAKLGEILFDKLQLKSGKKNKTGHYSTDAKTLEKLAEDNQIVADVLKYRQYQKLYSTYIEGLRPLIKNTGLVHSTFNQTVTSTGRLSSTNPNLQNIPVREDEGKAIRKMFIPKEGNVFIDADYSQIELRLLAHFSGCNELITAYNTNTDVHAVTASQVFNVPVSQVTEKMRREAKAVNFGIIYGISSYGLSKSLDIPVKVAKEYIDKYFETYSEVKDYMNSNVEFAKEHGYVSTLTGRKRYIPEIKSPNFATRSFGERAAMNMPLQGSSADIIKIAMVNVVNVLKKANLKAKLILQVHDELILDCPENEVEIALEILKREMENAFKLKVPLTVDIHVGKNWYDAK